MPNFYEHDRCSDPTLLGGGGIKLVAASRLTTSIQTSDERSIKTRSSAPHLASCSTVFMHLQARMRTALYRRLPPLPKHLKRPS